MFRKLLSLFKAAPVALAADPDVTSPGRLIPSPGLLDTIQCEKEIHRHLLFARAKCYHVTQADYVRIDHRAGPGGYADNFAGIVCCDCGRIMS